MPRERTILWQIASHQFIRTVYRAWVQTARGYSTVYPREVTDSTWVLLHGFSYTLVHTGVQVDEDSLPGFKMNESDLSADEESLVDSVL